MLTVTDLHATLNDRAPRRLGIRLLRVAER